MSYQGRPQPAQRWNPRVIHGEQRPRTSEISRRRAKQIFNAWASGRPYEELTTVTAGGHKARPLSVDTVRAIIRDHLKALWVAHWKWQNAELRCRAMAIELRYLRLGQECPEDQPIEQFGLPPIWLKAFKGAGIDTVNQLRSVDSETLCANWRFPRAAVDWAIMKLDYLKLSHRLVKPQRVRRSVGPSIGTRVQRE